MKTLFIIIIFISISSLSYANNIDSTIAKLPLNIIRTSEQKYKVKIAIMLNENSCDACINFLNPLFEKQYKNLDIDFKVYFYSENTDIIEKFTIEKNWKFPVIQDPMGLYAKYYNIEIYPSIVILDKNNNQIINQNFSNYYLFDAILNKIDTLAEIIVQEEVKTTDYKFLKTIELTQDDKKIITEQNEIKYFAQKQEYWLIDGRHKKIQIFDSVGKFIRNINLPYNNFFQYSYPCGLTWLNDSAICYSDYSSKGIFLITMNCRTNDTINTVNLFDFYNKENDIGGFITNVYYVNNKNNLKIFLYIPRGFRTVNENTDLLLMLDSNNKIINKFGKSPKWMEEYSIAFSPLNSSLIFTNPKDEIFFIISNSKTLNIFDNNGNLKNKIELDFTDNYHIYYMNIEYGEKYIQQRKELTSKMSFLKKIDIKNDTIDIIYENIYISDVNNYDYEYFFERFDKSGKRIIKNAIKLENNETPISLENNILITLVNDKNNNKIINWYEIQL